MVVGVTEWHGMMLEQRENPPSGVDYVTAQRRKTIVNKIVKSPIKGFFPSIGSEGISLVESIISPVLTSLPWVCSLANFQEVMSFSLCGMPLPKVLRRRVLSEIFGRDNFLGFAFWSHAGMKTLESYGQVRDKNIIGKASVIYPAISRKPDFDEIRHSRPRFLFSGDFFRKGGVHVVDAFERFQREFPDAVLHICSDPDIDFNVRQDGLKYKYLKKISSNNSIFFGRVARKEIIDGILPATTAYLLPTYDEAFGFAALESLAAGVPVIATTEFALPEIIVNGATGWLIPYSEAEKRSIMNGYVVQGIPEQFKERVTDAVFSAMRSAAYDSDFLRGARKASQMRARMKFSFEERNRRLLELYSRAYR
jgi:glycosyltransferase involved in cell wall biosynthesis